MKTKLEIIKNRYSEKKTTIQTPTRFNRRFEPSNKRRLGKFKNSAVTHHTEINTKLEINPDDDDSASDESETGYFEQFRAPMFELGNHSLPERPPNS